MARDRANIRIDMWADQDWRDLSASAQHLYLLLLSHPTLSYAGVADWKPGRLAAMTGDRTREEVIEAADELQAKIFIVVDDETEEVLIRSFIKHDGLLKQPKLVISMMNAYAAIASRPIREIIAFEVQKLRKAEPDLKIWEAKQSQTLLKAKGRDIRDLTPAFTPTFTPTFTPAFTPAFTPNADQAQGLPTTTSTTTSTKDKRLVQISFEQFWNLYPRRDGKKKAQESFEKALNKTDAETILKGVTAYIAFLKTTTQQTAMAFTWLNGERWNDEVLEVINTMPSAIPHARIDDKNGPYCQSCDQSWPCLTESKKGQAQF